MRKISKRFYREIEKYLYRNRWRLALLSMVYVLLGALTRLPYIGLIFTAIHSTIVLWIAVLIVMRPHPKYNFLFAILLVIIAMGNTLRGKVGASEGIGVIIFALIVIGLVQYFWIYLSRIRK